MIVAKRFAQEKGRYVTSYISLIIAGLVKKRRFLTFISLVSGHIKCHAKNMRLAIMDMHADVISIKP